MRRHHRILAILCLMPLIAIGGCKGKSAYEKALEERARWTVLALDWAQGQDNAVLLSTRLNGPPNSKLSTLTVRIMLKDAGGETIQEIWHVYDLTEVPRGGPKDITLHMPSDVVVDGLVVDPALRPDEADIPNIPELVGLE